MTLLDNLQQRAQSHLKTEETPVSHWWIWFAGITILGTIMRFWDLGKAPIWMDEAVTLAFAELDWGAILWGNIDNHPSFTWVMQKLWYSINPDPSAARVPVALFGSMSVAAILLAARDLVSTRAAIFAGALFAVGTAHIYYSQDARMYPYLVFGLILALWGSAGLVRPNLYRPRLYMGLYVMGGTIAIYSHAIGLIAMALIGFGGFAAGIANSDRIEYAKTWLLKNVILFVLVLPWLIALPGASGTFPGLSGDTSLTDIHWFYRNATGFPGLDSLNLPFEAIYYGLAALSVPIAWMSNRKALAYILAGLIVLFPIIMLIMHIRQPIMVNRIFLPSIIGVVLGVGYTLSRLKPTTVMTAIASVLVLVGFTSSVIEQTHRVKSEDYRGAYEYATAQGAGDAPVVTCVHFQTAAAWENRPTGRHLYYRGGSILDYQGREYWQAAKMSMTKLRAAKAPEIDAALGGGWLIEGGFETALEDEDQVLFIRPFCADGREEEIDAALEALGFTEGPEITITGDAADYIILERPQTRITIYDRSN